MLRTAIIAGGLMGLGIFTAAPAMADMQVACSDPCVIVPGLVRYYTGLGDPHIDAATGKAIPTAAEEFTTAWATGPATAVNAWVTGPATVARVWSDALAGPPPAPAPPPPPPNP